MPLPGGAQLINTHEDLLTAFTNIDQRLHRIIGGNEPPYIYRNKLYLPCSMYSIALGSIGSGGERLHGGSATAGPVTTEASGSGILTGVNAVHNVTRYFSPNLLMGAAPSGAGASCDEAQHRINNVAFLLSGGAQTDLELVPATAGFKGRMRILGLNANSADTYILTFQDSADLALEPATNRLDAVVGTAYVPVEYRQPPLFWSPTANLALEVDISGGAGTEAGSILIEYWYEP